MCYSAGGKSNVAGYILANRDKQIFAVVDGAAFGADMRSVVHACIGSEQRKPCMDAGVL